MTIIKTHLHSLCFSQKQREQRKEKKSKEKKAKKSTESVSVFLLWLFDTRSRYETT